MSAARTGLDADDTRDRGVRFGDHSRPPSKADPGPLVVELTSPGAEWRGRLGRWLEYEVTRALAAPSTPPARASFEPEADPHTLVGRALSLGASRLVVRLGSLRPVATSDGLLGVADSASLRRWAAAAAERPLSLELNASDGSLLAYDAPRPLSELLGPYEASDPPAPAAGSPHLDPAGPAAPMAPAASAAAAAASSAAGLPPGAPVAAGPAGAFGAPGARGAAEPAAAKAAPTRLFPGLDEAGCRACASELEAARGPHSLAQIEQLFVRRYLPLAEAEAFGIADASARRARAQWSAAFCRTYGEGFASFRPAGKRPTMVLDAPAIASRAARLHGARTTQLLLVDALRFDLGLRVHKRLGELLRGHAVCAERAVLWSALPSTTPTQLALLARGPEGLALPLPEGDEEPVINRGRGVDVPRRVKVGARDVLKLDLVEARLRDGGAPAVSRFDEVAEEVARAVAKCALALPPRTLLFVFGDHGFVDEAEGRGERAGGPWQGGATPEEVLVPGFAYLTGGVHLRRASADKTRGAEALGRRPRGATGRAATRRAAGGRGGREGARGGARGDKALGPRSPARVASSGP